MTKFKKNVTAVIAAVSLAASVIGNMSANAYSPTVTKNFTVGNSTATAIAYRDSSYACAHTKLSGGKCDVSLTYCGKTVSYTNYISSTPTAKINGSNGLASSTHKASKGGFSNSTSLTV